MKDQTGIGKADTHVRLGGYIRLIAAVIWAQALWMWLVPDETACAAAQKPETNTTDSTPHHLDRIDQRSLPLDGQFIPPGIGYGVTIYVIDTGVRITHAAFGKRAAFADVGHAGDLFGDPFGRENGADDCHGHGTHVAGVAAGYPFGVAPGADVRALRVTDCRGGIDPAVAVTAIDWIAENAERPAVALMSLSYGNAPPVRDAVARAVAAGIPFVVGGGNFDENACDTQPAGAPGAITVAAAKENGAALTFGNFGPCIDLFAPGQDILSADNASDTRSKMRSGSSQAAAVAAGAAALVLERFPEATPCDVARYLIESATPDAAILSERSAKARTPSWMLYIGDLWKAESLAP